MKLIKVSSPFCILCRKTDIVINWYISSSTSNGDYYCTPCADKFNEEKDVKVEEDKWYRVTTYLKLSKRPCTGDCLYKSKEDFLAVNHDCKETDFHWIHLEEFKR